MSPGPPMSRVAPRVAPRRLFDQGASVLSDSAAAQTPLNQKLCAIVTGAGSGIGSACAMLLASKGWHVVLVGRRPAMLEGTQAAIHDAHGAEAHTLPIAADVARPESAGRIVAGAVDKFGRVDALLNVAGHASFVEIPELSLSAWRETCDVNLTGPMLLTAAVWPVMREAGRGVIVNVSSMASIDPLPRFAMYATTKAGLNMFTKVTADEGAAHGIRAVAIAPGGVETPLLRSIVSEEMMPAAKTLKPEQVAELCVACAAGLREFTPGETIPLPSP